MGSSTARRALEQLRDEILLAASPADAAEAFRAAFEAALDLPESCRLLGRDVDVVDTVVLGQEHLRAVIFAGRERCFVPLDALDFPLESEAAKVVGAYRLWIGYFEQPLTPAAMPYFEGPPPASAGVVSSRRLAERIERVVAALALGTPAGLAAVGDLAMAIDRLEERRGPAVVAPLYHRLTEALIDFELPQDVRASEDVAVFIGGVARRWASARRGADDDPLETLETLWSWQTRSGGTVEAFEIVRDVAGAPTLEALERSLHLQLVETSNRATVERITRLLRELVLDRGDVEGFMALVPLDDWSCRDAVRAVDLLRDSGALERALEIVSHITRRQAQRRTRWNVELARLHLHERELLVALGRDREAFDKAWAAFEAEPSVENLGESLAIVPAEARAAVVRRALARAGSFEQRVTLALAFDALDELEAELTAERLSELGRETMAALAGRLAAMGCASVAQDALFAEARQQAALAHRKAYARVIEVLARALEIAHDAEARERWRQEVGALAGAHARKKALVELLRQLEQAGGAGD